jgi:hypothetical protein
MSVPIVFIHSGNSSYLFDTFYQLKQSNIDVPAYLIGTKESRVYNSMILHVDISDYMEEANNLASFYKHFSTNSSDFELICIQRWFILKDFMIKEGIEKCMYLDSDVLMYGNIKALYPLYESYGMTICGISGHTNFLNINTLTAFCQFIKHYYTASEGVRMLEHHYKEFIAAHGMGGISDMTFFTWFALEFPSNVCNLDTPDESSCFDTSLQNGEESFIMEGKFKKILLRHNKPYCIRRSDGKAVLFHTLHFQGGDTKKRMQDYVQKKNAGFFLKKAYFYMWFIFQKVGKRMIYT